MTLPNPYLILAALATVVSAYFGGMYAGYSKEHAKFLAFQEQVKIEAAKQEAKNESIAKQNSLINQGISATNDARIAAVRNYYSSGVQYTNPTGSNLPPVSNTTTRTIKVPADPEFVGRCAETTAQLISLQDWIKQQMSVK